MEDPPFLTEDPPPWAARALGWFLIAIVVAVATATIVVHVPETVIAHFVLVPTTGTDPVRAPRHGQVTAVRVHEGDVVTRGAPLVAVRSDPVSDLSAELTTLRAQLNGAAESEQNARAAYQSHRQAEDENRVMLEAQLASLDRSIAIKKRQRQLSEDLAASFKKGYDRGLISGDDYTARELEAQRAAEDESHTEGDRAQTAASIEKLHSDSAASEADYRENLRRLAQDQEQARIRIAAVTQQLAHSAGSEQVIISPCAGTVLRLSVRAAGAVVADGESLAEVACSDQRLEAELTVPQSGIGRVRPGQPVKLLYDAFPYQRFGVRRGRIRWVSPAGLTDAAPAALGSPDPQFRALVDLDDDDIRVDGRARSLLAGMGGQARVVIDRRTLVSYVFEPIRQLRESLAGGNE